ncbi:aminoglycoside phosphotransferase family protein [Streptomyces sp. SID3343]|uniref:phosphotransferase family protein n=1 Tax=Streptomyces sp. SID3343 TaxID=2690260 RepID=UPI00136D87DC|nr:aminoglycoside phosphotransferase family protein [Streptomyces sp. SID3343]MYW02784.1 phosphotransferase [Streptomyces sp. SID3343]
MRFRPIERARDAFQQSVTAADIEAMCARVLGKRTHVLSAVELGNGGYNSTYRLDLDRHGPVILRVAPEPGRQGCAERELMRNEHASLPYLAPIAPLLPRLLGIDFTHRIVGRDYLFQTLLDGVPARDGLAAYPRAGWGTFFRRMGVIAKDVHSVRGCRFGPVAGPGHPTWSDALVASLEAIATDLDLSGLPAADVRAVAAAAAADRRLLDEITEPRLLHGDLWTVNVMIDPRAAEPTISGVFDCDRTSWGDPAADWTVFMADRRQGAERDAFRDAYGPADTSPAATRRALYYRARHIGAIRWERHRLGRPDDAPNTHDDIREILTRLRT